MRKSILAFVLSVFAAVPASAFFEANVTGGYTLLNPGDINDILKMGTSVSEIKSGLYIAADAGVPLLPFVKLSPRVSAVFAGQGAANFAGTKATVDANLVTPGLGLTFDLSVPLSGLSARVGAWGGYGMATVTTLSGTNSTLLQGSAVTVEALAALRYSIIPFFSLGIEAGYRMANITNLKDTAGKEWKNFATNKAIGYDFSGANIGGGLTFSF